MATESLKFKIELYSTYWNKPPIEEVKVGDKSYFKNEITSTEKQPTLIEFVHDCESDKPHNLNIIRTNKNVKDVIKDFGLEQESSEEFLNNIIDEIYDSKLLIHTSLNLSKFEISFLYRWLIYVGVNIFFDRMLRVIHTRDQNYYPSKLENKYFKNTHTSPEIRDLT